MTTGAVSLVETAVGAGVDICFANPGTTELPNALTERGLRPAGRVSVATGCEAWIETWPARQERGRHLPSATLLPHFPKPARRALDKGRTLVLAGAREPVSFLDCPDNWADLAGGFGVPACSVYTDTEILVAFARALAEPGPSLIEAVLPG